MNHLVLTLEVLDPERSAFLFVFVTPSACLLRCYILSSDITRKYLSFFGLQIGNKICPRMYQSYDVIVVYIFVCLFWYTGLYTEKKVGTYV